MIEARARARREGWFDWIQNEADEAALLTGHYFDWDHATRFEIFCETFIKHSEEPWRGKPLILQPGFQRDEWFRRFEGWRRADGTRRFRKGFVGVPKKQTKTTSLAAYMMYGLIGRGRRDYKALSIANAREQAAILFNCTAAMIEVSPALAKYVTYTEFSKKVTFGKNSWYMALSADARAKDGPMPDLVVVDEIHEFAEKGARLLGKFRYAGISRPEPVVPFIISTHGEDYDDGSVWAEEYHYAKSIIKGEAFNDEYFAIIYEADPEVAKNDDWKKPEVHKAANPMYGITVFAEEMANAVKEAEEKPRAKRDFLRYRLNVCQPKVSAFINMEAWGKCGDLKTDLSKLEGQACFGGLDLSTTTDLTGFCLAFPPDEKGVVHFIRRLWIPEENVPKLADEDRVPYQDWIDQGIVIATPGNVIDYDFVEAEINELGEVYSIQQIGFDPHNATQTAIHLGKSGFEMVQLRPSYTNLSDPTKQLEKLVLETKLAHNNCPAFKWMARNLRTQTGTMGDIVPIKRRRITGTGGEAKDKRFKIDGMIALILAFNRLFQREDIEESVYEKRDPFLIGKKKSPET